jgi:peptidoglycan/xylan/chitin deacetylase (PgdA/CDA1 family)
MSEPVLHDGRPPARQWRTAAAPLAKSALLHLGGYAALRRLAPSAALAILRYHAICDADGYDYADPFICITPANFEAHVAYLTRAYTVIRLEDAVARLREGARLPPNAVAITFDDGYADNLAAARTLARYGASATFYLTAGCLGGERPFWPVEVRYLVRALPAKRFAISAGPADVAIDATTDGGRRAAIRSLTKAFKGHPIPVRELLREQLRALAPGVVVPTVMLSWDQVREMHRLGMTIGSHTMTHPNLPNAGVEAARRELIDSRARLEAMIDAPVTMFSYPNGGAERYCTPELKRVVAEVGFAAATTSRNAFATTGSDLYALERIEVEERLADLVFALEVERFAFKPQPRQFEA